METMTMERNLEEKTESAIVEKPHIFSTERDEHGKYICIGIKNKRYMHHSAMEIINILNKVGDTRIYIHATPEKVKIEYNPKYWKEIKSILKDLRYMFGNGYRK